MTENSTTFSFAKNGNTGMHNYYNQHLYLQCDCFGQNAYSKNNIIDSYYFGQSPEKLLAFLRTKTQRKANLPRKSIENRHGLGVS